MNRSLVSILIIISAFVLFTLTPSAAAQGRGAPPQPPQKEPPKVGAWWYTGATPPPLLGGHPDMTGVWLSGSSADLSKVTIPGQPMILTPYGAERYRTVDHAKDPNTQCLPPGPARMIMMLHPTMLVQRPDMVLFLSESQNVFRIIYTDGRPHPEDVHDYPEWAGNSIGHWEGDTLVVDTVAIKDRTWLDTSGHEHSDKLKLTEKFRLIDRNTLEMLVTYEDPVFFEKPFTTRRLTKRQIGDRIFSHSCLENEKDLEHLVPTLGDAGR
jgi:hypothetical protein